MQRVAVLGRSWLHVGSVLSVLLTGALSNMLADLTSVRTASYIVGGVFSVSRLVVVLSVLIFTRTHFGAFRAAALSVGADVKRLQI